jgi:hypothetical protein
VDELTYQAMHSTTPSYPDSRKTKRSIGDPLGFLIGGSSSTEGAFGLSLVAEFSVLIAFLTRRQAGATQSPLRSREYTVDVRNFARTSGGV